MLNIVCKRFGVGKEWWLYVLEAGEDGSDKELTSQVQVGLLLLQSRHLDVRIHGPQCKVLSSGMTNS